MNLYIVTGLNLGWDCICAVYDATTVCYSDLEKAWPMDDYVIHERTIDSPATLAYLIQEREDNDSL